MTEDNFSEAFADFYVENVNQYGDSEEGLELAYADFLEINGMDDEGLNEEIDAFSEFYSEMEDVYGDTEEGIEEAYADFLEIMNAEQGEEGDDFSELEEDFISYYTELADVYGDTEEGIEEAYADFMEAVEEEGLYEDESQYSEEDFYTDQEILEEFADFYADSEDIYGDDVEAAFDDYSDALEALAEEDYYNTKDTKNMINLKTAGGAVLGAGLGAGAGFLINKYTKKLDGMSEKRLLAKEQYLKDRIKELDKSGDTSIITRNQLLTTQAQLNGVQQKLHNPKVTQALAMGGAGIAGAAIGGALARKKAMSTQHSSEDFYEDAIVEQSKMQKFKNAMTGKNAKIAYASTGGAALAGGAAFMATKKIREKISYLKGKGNKLTDADAKELKALKMKLAAIIGGSAIVGAAAGGYGAHKYMNRGAVDKNESDMYAEGGSRLAKLKAWGGTNAGRATIGGVAGLATGVAIGALTDKNSAERKALKAKVKAGTATQAEQAKLKTLQTERRNRLLKAGAAGTVVGAGAGFASKGVAAAAKQVKFNRDYNKIAGPDKVSIFDKVTSAGLAPYKKPAVESAASDIFENGNDKNFSLLDEQPANRKSVNDAGTYVAKLIKP